MTEQTSLLSLPYIMPSQAQKHVTHNEALRMLDALLQIRVEGIGLDAPPADPADGERRVVGGAPTGAFAGHAGEIACWQDGAWAFFAPRAGWLVWDADEGALMVSNGAAWVAAFETQNIPLLGVNTMADSTNRFAVAAPATLLSHEGAGHQLKVNKAGSGDTASLLFQTGWSGRAEMGLAGNDDFSVKVSADGAAWATALRTHAANGFVGVGTTEARYRLTVGQPPATDTVPSHFDKTVCISGAGAAYYRGEDTSNGISFVMGTSTAGYVLLASMSNHPFVIRVNNATEAIRAMTDGRVGMGTAAPAASAKLDVSSTTQGFLPPRMTTTQRDAIAAPAEGLMIYNTTDHEPQFWNGSEWKAMTA